MTMDRMWSKIQNSHELLRYRIKLQRDVRLEFMALDYALRLPDVLVGFLLQLVSPFLKEKIAEGSS